MGFGCNAAGVVGCRIIDSPRERLIAVLTNSLVPCNGRFPILISVITIFFIGSDSGFAGSLAAALLLTSLIALSVAVTLLCSRLLSKTVLKGQPSSFVLEMPPYRKPQFLRVIIRSVFDRTLFVLGRAVCAAAPAGLVIWLLANIYAGDISLLRHCAGFLDPFARLFGLDGIILMAFILGLPANETVIPIAVMAYMSSGMLTELSSDGLRLLFEANGWNAVTAVSVLLFTLFHWPCATTLMTVAKETKSVSWTALAFALPTAVGLTACFIFANTAGLAM